MQWKDVTSYPSRTQENPHQPRTYETQIGDYRIGISKAQDLDGCWTGYAFGPFVSARRISLETKVAEQAKEIWIDMLLDHFQELATLLVEGR